MQLPSRPRKEDLTGIDCIKVDPSKPEDDYRTPIGTNGEEFEIDTYLWHVEPFEVNPPADELQRVKEGKAED